MDAGKTSLLFRVWENLGELRSLVDGFLTRKAYAEGKLLGYDLFDLGQGDVFPFIRTTLSQEGERLGRFYFLPEGLEKAVKIILRYQTYKYLIVDEVGPLELGGRGLWPALSQQVRRPGFQGLLVIRVGLIDSFLELLQDLEVKRFDMESKSVELDLMGAIREACLGTFSYRH